MPVRTSGASENSRSALADTLTTGESMTRRAVTAEHIPDSSPARAGSANGVRPRGLLVSIDAIAVISND